MKLQGRVAIVTGAATAGGAIVGGAGDVLGAPGGALKGAAAKANAVGKAAGSANTL